MSNEKKIEDEATKDPTELDEDDLERVTGGTGTLASATTLVKSPLQIKLGTTTDKAVVAPIDLSGIKLTTKI